MTAQKIELNIAAEFSTTPGPRKRAEADSSGEEFLDRFLRPRFKLALESDSILHVNLDGAAGYPTSFLEEAFGGLAREFGAAVVDRSIELTCNDEPYLEEDIRRYIREVAARN